MDNNENCLNSRIYVGLLASLDNSINELSGLSDFFNYTDELVDAAESYLMNILTINSNVKLITDMFIEKAEIILGKDYVDEQLRDSYLNERED